MFTIIHSSRSLLLRTVATFAIGATAALITVPTYAASDAEHTVVKFEDLDLSTADGAATLYTRLRSASRTVCAAPDTRNLRLVMKYKACTEQALDAAIQRVNDARLTSLHEQVKVAANRSHERTGA